MMPQPGSARTPEELDAQASQVAQDLFMRDETTRKSMLAQIRAQDPIFQRMVIDNLEKMRNQARTNGLAAAQSGQQPMQTY
jgi:hypothetical protein